MTDPRVSVVLATYNGERYLPQMLDSIAGQTRRPDAIVLRDDGSSDASVSIVQAWGRESGIAVERIEGPRLGAALSFMDALRRASAADLYLFADQDDAWIPAKVERAMARVDTGPKAEPTLYATRLTVTDEALRPISITSSPRVLGFSNALYESVLTGCTMALNAPLRGLLVAGTPDRIAMHDWWAYLVASALGKVVFDDHPTVLYRQHGSNAIGASKSGLRLAATRAISFLGGSRHQRSAQLRHLVDIHRDRLPPDALGLAMLLLKAQGSLRSRLRAAVLAKVERQRPLDQVTTRITLLMGRY